MDKSTRTRTRKEPQEGETNTALIKDQIMTQAKSHLIANVKYDKCLYQAVQSSDHLTE